jgi:hypothetical protein
MTTEEKWKSRIASWKQSRLSAVVFCEGKDFSVSGLRYWVSRLKRERAGRGIRSGDADVRLAQLVPVKASPIESEEPIVLELGPSRIHVRRGFNRETLRDLIAALCEGGRT